LLTTKWKLRSERFDTVKEFNEEKKQFLHEKLPA